MARKLPHTLRKFARRVRRDGWTAEVLNGGHIRFSHPAAIGSVTSSSTSRDQNLERILAGEMRRNLRGRD